MGKETDYKKIYDGSNGHNGQERILEKTDYIEEIMNKEKLDIELKGYFIPRRF